MNYLTDVEEENNNGTDGEKKYSDKRQIQCKFFLQK